MNRTASGTNRAPSGMNRTASGMSRTASGTNRTSSAAHRAPTAVKRAARRLLRMGRAARVGRKNRECLAGGGGFIEPAVLVGRRRAGSAAAAARGAERDRSAAAGGVNVIPSGLHLSGGWDRTPLATSIPRFRRAGGPSINGVFARGAVIHFGAQRERRVGGRASGKGKERELNMAFSQKESELVVQLPVFAAGIAANIALYQVSQADADAIAAAVDDFVEKHAAWNNPATRTIGTLEAKDAAKFAALGICRVFYRQVQVNQGISNESKLLIGVTPLNTARTRRNCPQTSPALSVVAGTPAAQTVQFRDSTDLTRRGLPMGATMCQLFVEVGAENAQTFDQTKARFVGNYTTNPMAVLFDDADRGKQATYFARWGGKRNEFGQWSLPVSMTIAA